MLWQDAAAAGTDEITKHKRNAVEESENVSSDLEAIAIGVTSIEKI